MNLSIPLIITCIIIVLALIIFPLIISYKAEKQDKFGEENQKNLTEWEKIKKYENKINEKSRKNK